MKELHRKKYRLEIKIPFLFFTKRRVFYYRQGTFKELFEMISWIHSDEDILPWMFHFLNTYTTGEISKREFKKVYGIEKKRIYEFLMNTFAKGFMKREKRNKPTLKPYKPKGHTGNDFSIFNATVASMSEMIGFQEFMNLTPDQLEYISIGKIWNYNETDKKGQTRNRIYYHAIKEDDEANLAKLKKIEGKLHDPNK